jgi:hypothetical protein
MLACLSVIPVAVFLILCHVQTASCQPKPVTNPPATTTTKPATPAIPAVMPLTPQAPLTKQSPAAPATPQQPPVSAFDKPVDMVMILKNQLRQCETNAQQLDKDNDDLRKKNTDLQKQLDALQQKNAALQKQVDNCTKPGGSTVKAYCESSTVSRNTAGSSNYCVGYLCEPVSGLCRTSCSATQEQCDSRQGWVCDTMYGKCVRP